MVNYLLFFISGIAGGILGGMGMGGGTVLIPILDIFFNVGQHTAQAVNLLSFIPMSAIALIIHLKNRYISFKDCLIIIICGIAFCFVGCFIARKIDGIMLKKCFGAGLVILSVVQAVIIAKTKKSKK